MTVEDERTNLENLQLSRLIKENHGECLVECCFFKSEIKDIYNPTNLMAVIGGKQANIYDNEHCGTHLDIMSQYNCDINLSCCCWIKVDCDVWLAVGDINGSIHILSIAESEEIVTFHGHSGPIYDIIPGKKKLITCADEGIFIWDLQGNINQRIACDATRITVDRSGTWLVAGNLSGSLYKVSLTGENGDLDINTVFISHATEIDYVQIVGDNVLTKSVDGKIVYWNLETESIIFTYNTRQKNKCRIDISDNLVFVGEDALVWRFDYKPPTDNLKEPETENQDLDPIVQ
ncbi:hypothetical protein HDV01_005911 [Terramyces sp. JEL0728]|nr:hypothetical protein HDV01_005911 [Terramyces sp. JEL0728]